MLLVPFCGVNCLAMASILIKNGTLVTMDQANTIVRADLLIRDERIAEIGNAGMTADTVIDAGGCAVMPGFVQTHIHLCQTIFRGAADDLALIDWLKQRVWPMEAAHSAASIKASARPRSVFPTRDATPYSVTT